MSLAMSLRARGPVGSAVRTVNVLSRFGASVAAMERRLDLYESITADLGIHPTWPATACVLGRHPALLRRYAERGAELTVHGLVHGDHSRLGARLQRDTLSRATEIFERAGLRPKGFRGPYLRYNAETLDVLRELEFWYHSSQAVVFPLVDAVQPTPAASGRFALACELYSAIDARTIAVTPRLREGLVDIPVAIPDDEILVERLGVNVATATAQWLQILDDTYRRGELFTVQLHPERIIELGDALGATCVEARRRSPAVYIARLEEIAAWWLRRSRFTIVVARSAPDRLRVHIEADEDATVLVRGIDVECEPWYGRDAVCRSRDFEVASPRAPIVGLSPSTPVWVGDLLREEGMPFEISDRRESYGAYVDAAGPGWTEARVLEAIETAPGPLVRIWRWPDSARSALAVTGDIDALTLRDFALRSWETRGWSAGGGN